MPPLACLQGGWVLRAVHFGHDCANELRHDVFPRGSNGKQVICIFCGFSLSGLLPVGLPDS